MSLVKSVMQGMMGSFYMSGIEIIDIDFDKYILTISLPEKSFEYEKPESKIRSAEDYARRLKTVLVEMGIFPSIEESKIRYITKPVYWTKEMGQENFNKNRHNIINIGGF